MVLRISDNHHATAVGDYDARFRDAFRSVVGAFALNVGAEPAEKSRRRSIREHRDVVDDAQRCDELSALELRHHGAPLTLELPNRRVAVECNDEYVSDVQGEDLDLSNAVDVGNPAYVGVDPTYQNSASVTNAPFVSDEERDVFHAGKASETSKARVSRLPGSVA